jgi:hypothetical protein
MFVATIILWTCALYLVLGTAVGIPFVWRGVDKVDAAAAGTSWGFRLMILSGSIALWPLVVRLWLRAEKGGRS